PAAAIAAGNVFAVEVAVTDAYGNLVPSPSETVTLALGSNPTGDTLGGTKTVTAVGGIAAFTDFTLRTVGTGYTLVASAPRLTSATSTAFAVVAATPSQLVFSSQPTDTTAGVALPAVTLRVLDAFGNLTSASGPMTVTLGANPGGDTLGGTRTVNTSGGTATFSDLVLTRAASGYTLAATFPSLADAASTTFAILPAAPRNLAFTTQPSTTEAGANISPAVEVTLRDAFGNTATQGSATVTVALGENPGNGTLSGTLSVAAVAGVARFGDLSVDRDGTGYTLVASSGPLSNATSHRFDITASSATQLAFTVQPSSTVAGVAIAPAVEVALLDALGNPTPSSASVTLTLDAHAAGGTLSGTVTVAAVNGVARFTNLIVDKVGAGYTLSAASGTLTGATSGAFDVAPAAPVALAFTAQPSNTTAGAFISPAVQVAVRDAFGNLVTTATDTITLSLGANPGGGTLSGSVTVNAVNGVATFSNLSLDKAGTGYTLVAASGSLAGATSAAFDVGPGVPNRLVLLDQPTSTVAGLPITPAVRVAIDDAFGNRTNATANVTLALAANPSGGTLAGTVTVAAVAGVATFSNLAVDRTGVGYTLAASSGSLTGATSAPFDISPAAPSRLAFVAQPSSALAGQSLGSVQVYIQDAFGNLTSSTANVSLALGANPGGGALSGTTTVAAVAGVATFAGLSIDKAGVGYTLEAASGSFAGATSAAFDITAGPPSRLAFRVQPSTTEAGQAFAPTVALALEDAFGNLTSSTANVTVALGANPGGGSLAGVTTVAAVNGVASFPGLSIAKAGNGYTLTASSGALPGATSTAFDIFPGSAARLAILIQPSSAVAGDVIAPAVEVAVQDAAGNTLTGSSAAITVALGMNPGGGTPQGTLTRNAVNGVATFADLSLQRAGSGYTLVANSVGLSLATSTPFDITAGPAARLAFAVQPSNATAGQSIAPAVAVSVEDAFGNRTGSTASVTVALGANPGGGTLSGSVTVAAVAGVATFPGLSIDKAGAGHTLSASSGALSG
ncbi:MAG TPA: hemagglutinin, partial [Myxococcaceae bacterium]|nr:hemagglutinin [Myxococcaceae bacterium]